MPDELCELIDDTDDVLTLEELLSLLDVEPLWLDVEVDVLDWLDELVLIEELEDGDELLVEIELEED